MGLYNNPIRQNVRIDLEDRFALREEVDSLLEDIQEGQMQSHIDNVMTSSIGRRIVRGLLEEGYSHKEVEQMFLEAAKKSKKKKKKEESKSKDDSSDSDIDVDDIGNSSDIPDSDSGDDKKEKKSKKKDSKDKDDSDSDDLDIDDGESDSDSNDESKSKDKKSKKKSKDSKDDKSSKDDSDSDDLDIDDSSVEDKSDSSKSKKSKKKDSKSDKDDSDNDEDDSDSKDSSKSKAKKSDKDSKDDSDDLKLEQVDLNVFATSRYYKPDFRSILETAMDKEYKVSGKKVAKSNKIETGKEIVKDMKKPVKESTRWRLPPGYIPPDKNKYWDKIVMEHFDMKDDKTRVVLITCNEEAQSEVLYSLTDKLYDIIVDKAATIDYGTIRESRGDIRTLQNYSKLEECVELLHQLLIEYKQDSGPVDEIKMAMDNLANRADMFKKCYMSGIEFGVLTYETITLAVVASTSLMLSTSVEFIKSANDDSFQIALDRTGALKAKNHLLFTNLKRFNSMCADKSLDKTLDTIIREYGQHLLGLGTMSGLAVAALITVVLYNFLPMLRELTYFFYYTRTRISDYFNIQADLLELNAHDIEAYDRKTVGDRKTVVKRQLAIAEKFRSIADFFMVDSKQAEQKATTDIVKDKRKLKTDDVMDDIPDNNKSALF